MKSEDDDDSELVSAWVAGDTQAGDQLMKRYSGRLWPFFANKIAGSPEDLVQQTLMACAESIARYEGRSTFRSYIFAIARNLLYRHYRGSDGEFDPLSSSVVSLGAEFLSPEDLIFEDEQRRSLLRTMRALPLESQVLLELRYWEAIPDRELAEIMGIPVGTVKSRMRKARAQFEEQLASAGVRASVGDSDVRSLDSWAAELRQRRRNNDGGAPG